MQVKRIQYNNQPYFNARLNIIDKQEILDKSEIEFLCSQAAKVGTKKDFITVKLGDYEFGETETWAEQGSGWMSSTNEDMLHVSVKSVIDNKPKKEHFIGYGYGYIGVAEDIVKTLTEYFAELAHKY